MATYVWTGGSSGNFDSASNWQGGVVPPSGSTIEINGTVTFTSVDAELNDSTYTFDTTQSGSSVYFQNADVSDSTFTFIGSFGVTLDSGNWSNTTITATQGAHIDLGDSSGSPDLGPGAVIAADTGGTINIDNELNNPNNFSLLINGGTLDVETATPFGPLNGAKPIDLDNNLHSVLLVNGLVPSTTTLQYYESISTGVPAGWTDMPCFVAGTRILTRQGEWPVESLMALDIVLTLSGEKLVPQPVKWVGRRRIDLAAHPRPETVAPIRIQRDAFADGVPHTDLLVSPDHAIFIDDKLICARQLVNGSTIRQEQGLASIEYFHVELNSHAILLAEGLPAESYLDTGNRGFFSNSAAPLVLHPDLTGEADYPAREAASCAPLMWDEATVLPVWQRLADRAADLGRPAALPETTCDPHLCVIAKERTIPPLCSDNGLFIFVLPQGTTRVRLVSRAAAPTDAKPWLEDRRRLGVYVERIQLRTGDEVRDVPLDHPELSQGWWAVERSGYAMRRWTDGDAFLSLPASNNAVMLEIRASASGISYVKDADRTRLAA
jgi:hypothetical protein